VDGCKFWCLYFCLSTVPFFRSLHFIDIICSGNSNLTSKIEVGGSTCCHHPCLSIVWRHLQHLLPMGLVLLHLIKEQVASWRYSLVVLLMAALTIRWISQEATRGVKYVESVRMSHNFSFVCYVFPCIWLTNVALQIELQLPDAARGALCAELLKWFRSYCC
jgi:hypothetical protein